MQKEKLGKQLFEQFLRYQQAKRNMDERIVANEQWYKGSHWQFLKSGNVDGHEPVTSYLHNAIWNKHADAMDAIPQPFFYEREPDDVEEAKRLTDIMPVVLDNAQFENSYSKAWYSKLKDGFCVFGVFWDPQAGGGTGDINITCVDNLRIYAEPGINDIQLSKHVFVVTLVDADAFKLRYPNVRAEQTDITQSLFDEARDTLGDKVVVIDCYTKEISKNGTSIVVLDKLCGEKIIESTRDDEATAQAGLYDHGMYPFVVDRLIPLSNSIYGMGLIDLGKSTQGYIDKLDYIIERNAHISGRQRFIVRESAGVNAEDLADISKEIVMSAASADDGAVRPLQAASLPAYIIAHRQSKIQELKEVLGNRDFMSGGVAGGVTAYSAIAALQEAGSRTSRDSIKEGLIAYKAVITLAIELIRQFYNESRSFAVRKSDGNISRIKYKNDALQNKEIKTKYASTKHYRKPLFDINVVAGKQSSFSAAAHNSFIMELFAKGAFAPEFAKQAYSAVNAMELEQKDKILEALSQVINEGQQTDAAQLLKTLESRIAQ